MKEKIIKMIKKEIDIDKERLENLIEIPPKIELGDYSLPCYFLAKKEKRSPVEIAYDLAEKLRKEETKELASIEAKGPYVNFFLNKNLLAEKVIKEAKKDDWGKIDHDKRKIGIEYPGPNTNKALHVGHLRNIAIGESVSNIARTTGNKVYHLNIFNDRGILISKSMAAYRKYKEGKTPESENKKADHFLSELYTRFTKEAEKDPSLEEEAKEILRKWEEGDKETIKLWKKMNNWAYKGMQETFERFKLSKIDKNYYESELYKKGKLIIEEGLKKRIFYKKPDNAVAIDLNDENLGEKILLRKDNTSIYITQDLYLAEKRINDFQLDSSYYIVGNDQIYHFKALFCILKRLGIKRDLQHLSYGMVALPEGKMKSRQGNVISADELIDKTEEIARKGVKERSTKISEEELKKRAKRIALCAIKYNLLKSDIKKQIVFNPKESLAFEGDTGPYLLYSYARASSITRKSRKGQEMKIIDLKNEEIELIKNIESFPRVIRRAYDNLAPNIIAGYSFELAKSFNEFYHSCPVIGGIEEGFRLELIDAFKRTLKKSLGLLGIETLEEM